MPRPTAAQLAYGSATVIVSTIAMLLLSQTSTGLGVAVISAAALALGLLVALTVPVPRRRGRHAARTGASATPAPAAGPASHEGATPAARVPDPRTAPRRWRSAPRACGGRGAARRGRDDVHGGRGARGGRGRVLPGAP
ncbi:hypothetical protein AB0D29_08770, partial [Streptomyces sp. NPDC048424]|uniref:hypothetical protein n=1 Tax=Streptomyces sp. NPDC048424 TaxID=3155265 RepID=UPI0034188D18